MNENDLATAAGLFNAGGHTNVEVSNILGCKPRTVTNLRKRLAVATEEGVTYQAPPVPPKKRGRKTKDNTDLQPYRERLLELIGENPQITKVEMRVELGVSDYMLRRIIKFSRISHKRAHKQPRTRNTANIIQERRNFAIGLIDVPDERRIYLDETGFNLHTQEEYGWAPQGITPIIPVNANRGRNCTLLCAVSQLGVEAYTVFSGACNGEKLSEFLRDQLNPMLAERPSYVMLGNVRFHHSNVVRQSLHPDSRLNFLPAYSPQLNPIEEVFSLIKHSFKRQKISQLEAVIPGVIHAVQSVQVRENLLSFYRNGNRWLGMSFRGEPFPL